MNGVGSLVCAVCFRLEENEHLLWNKHTCSCRTSTAFVLSLKYIICASSGHQWWLLSALIGSECICPLASFPCNEHYDQSALFAVTCSTDHSDLLPHQMDRCPLSGNMSFTCFKAHSHTFYQTLEHFFLMKCVRKSRVLHKCTDFYYNLSSISDLSYNLMGKRTTVFYAFYWPTSALCHHHICYCVNIYIYWKLSNGQWLKTWDFPLKKWSACVAPNEKALQRLQWKERWVVEVAMCHSVASTVLLLLSNLHAIVCFAHLIPCATRFQSQPF